MHVKISELKARLSAFLDIVRRGGTVTVLDRKVPIAQITPVSDPSDGWRVRAPSSPPATIGRVRGATPRRAVDVVRVLRETRGDT